MRALTFTSLLVLSACTANINVQARPGHAEIYVTEYPPSVTEAPVTYVGRGTGSVAAPVNYFAWDSYYVWVGAPGYTTHIAPVPGEAKIGPIIGGCFFLFPWMWAYGPTSQPMFVELQAGDQDKNDQ